MVQALQYKGYVGPVLYSAEDKMLHGRVLGVRDMISYGGTDVRSLEKNFKRGLTNTWPFARPRAIHRYAFQGSFNVRIPQDLHQRAALYAEEHDLS